MFTNLSSGDICGRTCRTAQSKYPAAFRKMSTDARLLSATHTHTKKKEDDTFAVGATEIRILIWQQNGKTGKWMQVSNIIGYLT